MNRRAFTLVELLVPIINKRGLDGKEVPVGAIYKLDSDLKGNLVVFQSMPNYEVCSEEDQGKLISRAYATLIGSGTEKVFWYVFQDFEKDEYFKESYYGLVNLELTRLKPSYTALRTLISLCPPGSSRPELHFDDAPFQMASWNTPAGEKVVAVWLLRGAEEIEFAIDGKVRMIVDHLGRKVEIEKGRLPVYDGMTYIVGDNNMAVRAVSRQLESGR